MSAWKFFLEKLFVIQNIHKNQNNRFGIAVPFYALKI